MDKESLEQLEEFVDLCKIKPEILNTPELKFFKDWLLELGATVPASKTENVKQPAPPPEPTKDSSTEESDLDISMEGVVKGDVLNNDQFMGEDAGEVSEEVQDAADEKRDQALALVREGKFAEAINMFNEAIKLNPGCAMFYAKRANCYIKMQCPNAAIKDCNRSIELNPDSAQGYKWRGLAQKLLGEWVQAFDDLSLSLKLDYSDDAYEVMKEIEPKVKKIREHNRKYERKREEKEMSARRERVRKAQEANEKAKASSKSSGGFSGMPEGMGSFGGASGGMPGGAAGGMPGGAAGGMPGGMGMPPGMGGLNDLLSDPETVEDLKDPEVMKILSEVMMDPSGLQKHKDNPKITRLMAKMQNKFGDMDGDSHMDTDNAPEEQGASKPAAAHMSDELD